MNVLDIQLVAMRDGSGWLAETCTVADLEEDIGSVAVCRKTPAEAVLALIESRLVQEWLNKNSWHRDASLPKV